MAAGPAALGRAGARPGGPERRRRAAGQGRTGAQPALLPRPRGPARARRGPSRPSGARAARVRRLRNNPRLDRPPLPSLCRGPDVGPLPPRPGRPAPAARSPPALILRPPPEIRIQGLRCARLPERALRPAARRAAGRVLRRTEGAYCSHPRGAGLRARRSSPVGQEAGRRDPTPYKTRPLVGSEVGRSHSRGSEDREVEAGRRSAWGRPLRR